MQRHARTLQRTNKVNKTDVLKIKSVLGREETHDYWICRPGMFSILQEIIAVENVATIINCYAALTKKDETGKCARVKPVRMHCKYCNEPLADFEGLDDHAQLTFLALAGNRIREVKNLKNLKHVRHCLEYVVNFCVMWLTGVCFSSRFWICR